MFRHLSVSVLAAAAALCCGVGCSNSAGVTNLRSDTGADVGSTDADTDAADSGTGTSEPDSVPEWFRLGATVTVADGLPSAIALELALYDGDRVWLNECDETREGQGIVAMTETPDPTIYHWWRVTTADLVSSCLVPGQLPEALYLGVGALHAEVEAQLLSLGLDDLSGSLYGAYALLDADQDELDADDQIALAYGYGGTDEALAGEIEAQPSGPIPDGVYSLAGVFLFPLTPAP